MTCDPQQLLEDVQDALTRDDLRGVHRDHYDPDCPLTGHCALAVDVLQALLWECGDTRWKGRNAKDPSGIVHHWLVDSETGEILDPTAEQYTDYGEEPPYEAGRPGGPQGTRWPTINGEKVRRPSRDALRVLERMTVPSAQAITERFQARTAARMDREEAVRLHENEEHWFEIDAFDVETVLGPAWFIAWFGLADILQQKRQGFGKRYYKLWESQLPSHVDTLYLAPLPHAVPFWRAMGYVDMFRDSPHPSYMIKSLRDNYVPLTFSYPLETSFEPEDLLDEEVDYAPDMSRLKEGSVRRHKKKREEGWGETVNTFIVQTCGRNSKLPECEGAEGFEVFPTGEMPKTKKALYRGAVYRQALTPEQKEQKKDYLLEQSMQADCGIPSFKEIVEKHESLQWSLDDEEYTEHEGIDPDDLIREDYDDEGIREMAEERVQKELDVLDAAIKEIDEKCRYEHDEGLLNKCWDERDDLSYKRDKLVDKAVNHVWDYLREEYEEEVKLRAQDAVEARYEEFLSDARDELDGADEGDVWRVVMVDPSVDPTKLSGIGRFWTRRKDLARPFLDFDEGERLKDAKAVRFRAKVDHEYVDVCDTLEANVWGKMTGNQTDETEVRFYKHAPVYVYEVEVIAMDPNQPDLRGEIEVLETLPIEGTRRA